MTENEISKIIIGLCINVHKELGPGLLESAYAECLNYELLESNICFEREKPLKIIYKNVILDCGYRLDFIIENKVVIELKTVEKLLPIHEAQIITYLKLSECKLGLLINFNVAVLRSGIKRFVNQL
jgi:GxxExxY protein